MKTAVCYYRVSRNIQSDLRQERDVIKYCKDNNYTIVETFREKISGTIRKRPEMTACLDYIDTNNIKFIVCSELSRLGRTNEVVAIIDDLTEKHICVICIKESIKTLKDDFSKDVDQILLTNILTGISLKESDSISYRIKSGINQKVLNNGAWSGGKFKPYGYTSIEGKLVIDIKEAEIVKLIFEKYLSGWGSIKISNFLNLQGIQTKLGFKWQRSTINQLLRHSIYSGHRMWHNECLNTPDLAIVSTDTFESALKRMKEAKNSSPEFNKLAKYNYLLNKGIMICGICGKHFHGAMKKDTSNGVYKCISTKYHAGCGNRSIHIKWIEVNIQDILGAGWQKLVQDNSKLSSQIEVLEIDLKLQQQELTDQQQEQNRLQKDYFKGRLPESQYDKQYQIFNQIIDKITGNIHQLQEKITDNRTTLKAITKGKGKAAIQDKAYKHTTFNIDKDTLHTVVKQIVVNKDDIKVLLINNNEFTI